MMATHLYIPAIFYSSMFHISIGSYINFVFFSPCPEISISSLNLLHLSAIIPAIRMKNITSPNRRTEVSSVARWLDSELKYRRSRGADSSSRCSWMPAIHGTTSFEREIVLHPCLIPFSPPRTCRASQFSRTTSIFQQFSPRTFRRSFSAKSHPAASISSHIFF